MELLCKAISLLCSLAASIEMAFKAFKFRADAEFIFEEMIEISLFAFKFMLPLFVIVMKRLGLTLIKSAYQ